MAMSENLPMAFLNCYLCLSLSFSTAEQLWARLVITALDLMFNSII